MLLLAFVSCNKSNEPLVTPQEGEKFQLLLKAQTPAPEPSAAQTKVGVNVITGAIEFGAGDIITAYNVQSGEYSQFLYDEVQAGFLGQVIMGNTYVFAFGDNTVNWGTQTLSFDTNYTFDASDLLGGRSNYNNRNCLMISEKLSGYTITAAQLTVKMIPLVAQMVFTMATDNSSTRYYIQRIELSTVTNNAISDKVILGNGISDVTYVNTMGLNMPSGIFSFSNLATQTAFFFMPACNISSSGVISSTVSAMYKLKFYMNKTTGSGTKFTFTKTFSNAASFQKGTQYTHAATVVIPTTPGANGLVQENWVKTW